MVNLKGSEYFENKLLEELRTFANCKHKRKDPHHFCSQREFSDGLDMSLRDVSTNLSNLVEKRFVHHEQKVFYNHKLRDRFTLIDPRMFSPKDIMRRYKNYVNGKLSEIQALAEKMKKTPALYDVKYVKIPVFLTKDKSKPIPKKIRAVRPGEKTAKMNKRGFEYLESFCQNINRIFAYVDSLSYSQFAENIPKDDEYNKMILDLRKLIFNKTRICINSVVENMPKLQRLEIGYALTLRMPLIYSMIWTEKTARL